MPLWPVINDKVAIFKDEGGPIDEHFDIFDRTNIYKRQKDGLFYFFCKLGQNGHHYIRHYKSDSIQQLPTTIQRLIDNQQNIPLTICDPYSFYLQGGNVELQQAHGLED